MDYNDRIYCNVDLQNQQVSNLSISKSSIDITSTILSSFNQIFNLNGEFSNLTIVRWILCFHTEVISSLFIGLILVHALFRVDTNNQFSSQISLKFIFSLIYLVIFIFHIFLAFFPDFTAKSSSDSNEKFHLKPIAKISPEEQSTFLSKLTFTWFSSTIWTGSRRTLTHSDVFLTSSPNRVQAITNNLQILFEKKQNEFKCKLNQFRLIFILLQQFWTEFVYVAMIKLIPSLLTFMSPILLDRLIKFVKNDEPSWHGYIYISAMFGFPLVESLLNAKADYSINMLALKIRSCLTASIYKHMLYCRSWSMMASRYTSGQLVNLMSIDTQRVLEYVKMINLFWICPLQIIISTVMLWSHLGYGSLAGLVVLLLLLPFNGFIGARLRMLQGRLLDFKDRRIKLLNETIMSIRAIKLYAWEEVFQYRIQKIRKQEMANLRQQAFYSTAITFAFNSAPFLVAFASFALYLVLDENNSLDASKMFVSLAIFNIVRRPLAFFPQLITNSLMFMVSLKRISEFLNFTSNEDFIVKGQNLSKDFNNLKNFQQKTKPLIQIDKCTFSWSSCDKMINRFLLKNISISITEPKLYAIIGEVGTGKSSLLSAVLGQMSCVDHESHKFTVNGTIAYVPQNAWIQYGTIRENILFGLNYDYKWYNKVIETCALEKDFSQFQDGDNMIVGQKGFSLSGGQKQRISIARALYSNADIILLDDPLSALDSHIAKHVFNRVIGPTGLLSNKIRLLATHNMAILPQVDHILVMKNGSIVASGCYHDLMNKKNAFTNLLTNFLIEPISYNGKCSSNNKLIKSKDHKILEKIALRMERKFHFFENIRPHFLSKKQNEPKLISFKQCIESQTKFYLDQNLSTTGCNRDDDSNLRRDLETLKIGSVPFHTYFTYIRRFGFASSIILVLNFLIGHVFILFGQLWLSTWSGNRKSSTIFLMPIYEAINSKAYSLTNRSILLLAVYGLFGLGQTIFILVGTLLLNIGCLAASHHLHNQMLARILTAPIWFYDATSSSIGQILNRFSKDIDVADSTLISNFLKLMIELFRTIISFIPIVFGTDLYIMLIIIPLTLLYFAIYKYCISTSRQLIRIESSLRTPIYSFFTETYSGVSVIQAFGIERKFLERSHRNIDMNASAYHMSVTASRWLTIRLDFLGNLVVLSTALFCTFKRNQIDPGMVGLCLSCAYTITGTLNMLVRSFTDLESNIVSVERLIEYTELPQEAVRYVNSGNYSNTLCELNSSKKCSLIGKLLANYVSNMFQTENGFVQQSFTQDYQIRNPNSWLRNGSISICQFSARYRTNLKLCLRHLNVSIENGQKVAIIGRTGAGKSSFALSLFRLIEAENGCIYIGGQNIKDLGLYELRSALTIIPQDSLLFNGTLRENMDPLGQYTDDQIFSALEKVNLTKILKRLTQESNFSSVLEQPLNDSCMQSISAGQKQLFCLARVLLQNPKIVILDEATASIDPATDELVQETIYREFHNCTVLSIVHKLELIVRYPIDKVLVFDNGSIVEYDSPKKLANDSKSYFFRMLNNQI
ncbi:hypothetical protein BLOT_004273 [Blomia tropicalis]|nr:hypothetical protein BLOT_004273 [Blomia tropicalis]